MFADLEQDDLTRWGMPVRACCVFDTVGTLSSFEALVCVVS